MTIKRKINHLQNPEGDPETRDQSYISRVQVAFLSTGDPKPEVPDSP
jgi:hypothetical protein